MFYFVSFLRGSLVSHGGLVSMLMRLGIAVVIGSAAHAYDSGCFVLLVMASRVRLNKNGAEYQ